MSSTSNTGPWGKRSMETTREPSTLRTCYVLFGAILGLLQHSTEWQTQLIRQAFGSEDRRLPNCRPGPHYAPPVRSWILRALARHTDDEP